MLISETLDIRGRIETWELIVILRNILRRLLDYPPGFWGNADERSNQHKPAQELQRFDTISHPTASVACYPAF